MNHFFSSADARKFYNFFGAMQDKQFYEQKAVETLVQHAEMGTATSVLEFGCGTGKLAKQLLTEKLPLNCQYHGIDISNTMIDLCESRLTNFADRAQFTLSEGGSNLTVSDASVDRVITTYVLDLLNTSDIENFMHHAHAVLRPDGLLCHAGLAPGISLSSKLITRIWKILFSINPMLVGGCRPLDVKRFLDSSKWELVFLSTVVSLGIPSAVLVARKK